MRTIEPRYLGDGVYASFDGYMIWLRTSNGLTYTNEIALEPDVMTALLNYLKEIQKTREENK